MDKIKTRLVVDVAGIYLLVPCAIGEYQQVLMHLVGFG